MVARPTPIPKCGTCQHWHKDPTQLNQGVCRGGPPAAIAVPIGPGQVQIQFQFALCATATDGCSLHQDWPAYVEARAAESAPIKLHSRFHI